MWDIEFIDSTKASSSELEFWDNVPKDKAIKKLVFTVNGFTPLTWTDFDYVSVAKIAIASLDMVGDVGHCITLIKDKTFTKYTIVGKTFKESKGDVAHMHTPWKCFRKGIKY